jgi:hypothetical protein
MSGPNAQPGKLISGNGSFSPLAGVTVLAVGAGGAVGLAADAFLQHFWPEPYAPLFVFGAFCGWVFIGVEIVRWKRPGRLMPIFVIANGLYFAAVIPMSKGLEHLILGGTSTNTAEYWAVSTMAGGIVIAAFCLLLRASFTREEERALWTSYGRDTPGSSEVASGERGT